VSVFKTIIKYALIAMAVKVLINLASGNGSRAGTVVVGYGGVIALALVGWALTTVFSGLKPLFRKGMSKLDAEVARRSRNRAYEELLKIKELHDAGILSDDEYATKTEELKKTSTLKVCCAVALALFLGGIEE